jgi:hypothetical protein
MVDLDNPLAHFGPKAGRLNPIDHHGQVGVLGCLNQDAPIAILDLVELTLLAPTE